MAQTLTTLDHQVLFNTLDAVRRGEFSVRLPLSWEGLDGKIADAFNDIVSMEEKITKEIERVTFAVGTEGKLGQRMKLDKSDGAWDIKVESINRLIENMAQPIRDTGRVMGAVARGVLNQSMELEIEGGPLKGEFLKNAKTINIMVDQLNAFAGEVTRVAREVGTEGKLGGQAQVKGVSGVWKDLTDNVNLMAGNLTGQVRNIAEVTTAVANGDLSRKITVDVKGEILELKNTINIMVDQLNAFAGEVTRVAREVGTEGKLGGQAQVKGISGVWKDLTDSVNAMAGNLTAQVRNIAGVTTAVAKGDLSQKITADVRGEVLQLKDTINIMVDQLNAFAGEVTRVAREVGTEGKLGGQAQVKGISGVWKDLTDNVNLMAGNLTGQVRNIAEVTTAVATGDLSRKITVDVKGEILELKNTINIMVDQLNAFAGEVTRVAREVGTEGKLGGQAQVKGISGVWKDLTDNVNLMAGNLTGQVRNIAEVTTAVATGDLSRKITVDVKGEILELKNTINIMVDQLNAFASEVTRVAREVGIEGKLGGQAQVKGVSGVWQNLTDNVNLMAGNLTGQVRNIAGVTTAVAKGDLSQKITADVRGEVLQLKETINTMVDQLNAFAGEVTRVAREVGTEGKLGGQAQVPGVAGVWKDLTDNVNAMAGNLTVQVRNIAGVTTAVAKGDLSQKITVDVRGEVLQLKDTINIMVDQLNSFSGEVTRVAREVGTEGKLGGQAQVKGVSGVWKDLTDSVNVMADNLTDQVRGIAKVVTGVAVGNLKQKMMVPAKGEVASLADTINDMMDTLATFSDQVTRVAREVGVEGKLGGQATVPGAAGSWKDLVDNVNELAANLTTQVRAIGEVAIAVTKGDLTRSIQVAASGEVADLKDNVNQMILNLKETTQRNTEQDWLKTNLARLIRMLQGQRDTMTVARTLLSELAPLVAAQHAVLYTLQVQGGATWLRLMSSYGYQERKNLSQEWAIGEGLVGQAAFEKQRILVSHVPYDYIQIVSGLGQATPRNLIVLPILFEGQVKAVIELATFEPFQGIHLTLLDQLAEGLGIVFNSIESAASTEALLQQSQSLANELKSQQDELQNTNAELQQKALQLSAQNAEVERKNREIEVARASLQEQASQLALTSKYKSEFLANMSHELRTPLNSLLLLADQLNQNRGGNLTPQQMEMIEIIHGSGTDLLQLINDILDLSKIEAGTTTLEPEDLPFARLADHVDNTFRHLAEAKGLEFTLDLAPDLPSCVHTDEQRLQQVLKNLIANGIKFTERGSVTCSIGVARSGWSREHKLLNSAPMVIAFAVIDTGMGIPKDKQMLIFEAFQQADAGTSRRYGGTGLGLAISREIARLLDGELRVESEEGIGSTFTFYVPQQIPGGLRMKPRLSPETIPTTLLGERSIAGPAPTQAATGDDRGAVGSQDDVLLIIEDDPTFAQLLREMAHGHGFKALVAASGGEGIGLAQQFKAAAIILDIILPDIDGWSVADRLKAHPQTRDIPIHVISVRDRPAAAEMKGVASYLTKPLDAASLRQVFAQIKQEVARPARALLIIERDPARRAAILAELQGEAVDVVSVASASETLAELRKRPYQGVVLDLDVPEMDGIALLQDMRQDPALADIPVVAFTGRSLDRKKKNRFKQLRAMVIAGEGESALNRLAAGVKQFLQGLKGEKPEKAKPEQTELPALSNGLLAGKKALLVDDDIRNLFALTAVLESNGIVVVPAESGKDAIARLHDTPGIDIVLMDIMMPEMDGFETMRLIRSEPQFKDLPIIALTAKAMKGDREKCLAAGASDYASKPVDMEKLLARLRELLT